MLLADRPLPHPLPADLAAGVARQFRTVSLPAQHGESTALRHHLFDHRNLFTFHAQVLAVNNPGVRLHSDLRHVCAADCGGSYLDLRYWLDLTAFRIENAGLDYWRGNRRGGEQIVILHRPADT